MTIYDQDYLAELRSSDKIQQEIQAESAGVIDSAAVNHTEAQEPMQQPVEAEQPVEQVSDKELNFRALRDELAYIKEERDRLRQEFDGLRREQQVQRQPEPRRERLMDKIQDDDYVTGAQLKQSWAEKENEYQAKLREQELYLQELTYKTQYPDFDEVISKYGQPLVEQKPYFAKGFVAADNKAAYLYELGKMAMMAEQANQPKVDAPPPRPAQKAQQLVQNAQRPGTLSNPVGAGGHLSQTEYFATMSDAEFAKLMMKNLERV